MINSNPIASDTSSATTQGLTAKGKKGKGQSKNVFSSLMDILQKGKGKTGKKDGGKSVIKTEIKAVETGTVKTSKKQSKTEALTERKQTNLIKVTSINKGLTKAAATVKSETLQSKKTALDINIKVPVDDGSTDIIAVVQEVQLMPQQDKKIAPESSNHQIASLVLGKKQSKQHTVQGQSPLQLQGINTPSNTDIETQALDSKVMSSPVPSQSVLGQQSLPTQNTTAAPTNPTLQNNKTIENLASAPQTTTNPTIQNNKTIENLASAPQTTTETALNTKQVQNNVGSTTSSLTINQNQTIQADNNTTPTTRQIPVNPEQNIQPQHNEQSPSTNDSDGQNKDTKTLATTIVTAQRAPNQNQQTANSTVINANSSAISAAMADGNSSSSQQDFGSEQPDVNLSLLEAGKTDAKTAKGLDFQAQLAYKSQRTFTPSDTMLEIVRSAKTGKTSLELQLEPANLGKIQVSIQMDNAKNIQVSFTVDQNASRQLLEQQMPQLRIALAQQGLDLGGFSMQMNQQGGQQDQSGFSRGSASGTDVSNTSTLTTQNEQHTRIGVNLATHGHLSILA